MLQPKLSRPELNHNGNNVPPQAHPIEQGSVDILQELNRLEDMILAGFQIPLTGRTLIDEDKILEHLDFVRVSLPPVFQEAAELLQNKEEIMLEAEEYGQQVVEAAQAKRAQILADSDIIRHAEREAEQLRRKVQQECDTMMQDTLAEIDRKKRACIQELEEIRQNAIAQAQQIEDGADEYADNVLGNIEQDLQEILRIITNGRLQLRGEIPKQRNSPHPQKK